jgi:CBS domain containing-hemolysin-like protein
VLRRGRSVVFDASLRPDELADRAGVDVPPSEEWETVAGYVLHELQRLPELGDEVEVEGGVLRVERVDGTRIVRLRFAPHEPDDPRAVTVTPAQHRADGGTR